MLGGREAIMARTSPQTGPMPERAHHPADRFIAIYMRLSDASRRTAAQEADLRRWSDRERQSDLQRGADGRARGLRWGGSEKGRRVKVTPELEAKVKRLRAEGRKISHIARETGVSRPTIYKVLGEESPSTDGEHQSRKR